MDGSTDDCFSLVNISWWTACALQKDNCHKLLQISLCMSSICEFLIIQNCKIEISTCVNTTYAWKREIYLSTTTWTRIFEFHTSASLLHQLLIYQQIWVSEQSTVYTLILVWNLVPQLGEIMKIKLFFLISKQADILMWMLNLYLAYKT